MIFRRRAVVFRWRGVVGRICPRENAPLGEGFPTRRTSERVCPAQKRSPRRRPPDTAHGRKDLPAQEHAPRRRPPDTAHERKDLPAQERSPRRKPPDTAHEQKNLPRAGTLSSTKASRHGARAKGFAPREFALAPRADERRAALDRRTAGKTPLRRGRTREGAAAAEFIHRKKIRLLHEIQFFYGESHVGSRQIFPSFPSVDRCVARERNLVPPFAPRCGRGHRSLRRDGEMCHGFGEMVRRFGECPHGGEWLPRGGNGWPLGGGRYCPGLRCFGERFHRRRCANPDACRAPRCSHG